MSRHRRSRRERREPTAPEPTEQPEQGDPTDQVVDEVVAEAVRRTSTGLLSASILMAAGTVVSRLSGFIRSALIFAAIGKSLNADIFTGANTIPNAIYILVAGGIFNVVLVPQLVRAMKNDADGGNAYAQRIVTLGLLALGVATIVAVVATPLLVHLVFDPRLFDPANADALSSAYALMRYCLPQIFFYGAFVLIGQILNSRGRFGPMMWAPIANNLLACAILVAYIALYGQSDGSDGFTSSQEMLLGLGSTAGIALQTLILVPYLRAAGFHYRPRFDFRGVGLGHTLKLGAWTLAFILVNQVTYVVVNRIASSAGLRALEEGSTDPAGTTVYASAFLITQVPHGVITVSLVTATMPLLSRLAAESRWTDMRAEFQRNLRLVLALIVPIATAVAVFGDSLGALMGSWGALDGQSEVIGATVTLFAPAIVFFSLQYLSLRGFYALEDTRTPFFLQVVLGAVNITAAVTLTAAVDPRAVAPALAIAYGTAYLVGSVLSLVVLSFRIGPVISLSVAGFLVRLAVASAVAAAVMYGVSVGLTSWLDWSPRSKADAVGYLVIGGGLGALSYLVAAWVLRIRDVQDVVRTVLRRQR